MYQANIDEGTARRGTVDYYHTAVSHHGTIDEGIVRRGTVEHNQTTISHHRGTISHDTRFSHTYCIIQGELILSDNIREA